ncbi:hypothetical protein TNCV_2622991 [Trichonephila clavipes]|nr:hypothetical protein TNCV_2622991 [Trichonephila clavipes]
MFQGTKDEINNNDDKKDAGRSLVEQSTTRGGKRGAFAAWGITLNSRRATSPLVWLVEGEERCEAPGHPPGFSSSKLGWNRAKSSCHLHGAQS